MTETLPPIVAATSDDVPTIAHLVAEAFGPLRASQWLVPDPGARQTAMAGQFAILVDHALRYGHADLLADGSAVAVWFHRDQPIAPPPDYDRRLIAACGESTDRFRTLDDLFETHHPTQPHHHLAMLAVHLGQQSTGRGTLLLRHLLCATSVCPSLLVDSGQSGHMYCI